MAATRAGTLLGMMLLAACAPRPLLDRAIRARGGPLETVVRDVEADVRAGFRATWRWRTVFMLPDRYAWTIVTADEPYHYLFDGTTVRAFIGPHEVSSDTDPAAPLRSHARFTAVTNLDALRLPGVTLASLAATELPPGSVEGMAVVLADGARYRLGFDAQARLVFAAGPIALPPLASGELRMRYADFRRSGGRLLPFAVSYTLVDPGSGVEQPIADERTLAVCPNASDVRPESFRDPTALPECPPPAAH